MSKLALCDTAMNYSPSDRAYIDAHRYMFGELGERVATAAILFRDRLLRPGFVLPLVRLAPVAPYGSCMALSGNSSALDHAQGLAQGIWLYLHEGMFSRHGALHDRVDEVVLHELLHNELMQFGEDAKHKGEPWARRCRELSSRLGLQVRIERPRSIRNGKTVSTGTPAGCLSYTDLARWPQPVLKNGPSLRTRAEAPLCSATVNYTAVHLEGPLSATPVAGR